MKVLFWYCNKFAWAPTIKTLDLVPESEPEEQEKVVVAFLHVEPKDVEKDSTSETKLVKNSKWACKEVGCHQNSSPLIYRTKRIGNV